MEGAIRERGKEERVKKVPVERGRRMRDEGGGRAERS